MIKLVEQTYLSPGSALTGLSFDRQLLWTGSERHKHIRQIVIRQILIEEECMAQAERSTIQPDPNVNRQKEG